ncbi:hypothetical protein CBR_g30543 [Chara braunii]|uniref:HAT C-terminal dimerisation domain-containing protein n=1 Tax=Chara braunii TaxID=69332 RepID=A0A388LCY7_CHABU|nr:hypothetical protein CBR_g30543 [Chara braunii]|eukprot:GBG80177.1 hypothetical protein CBR_g30543 [Chara braunii]
MGVLVRIMEPVYDMLCRLDRGELHISRVVQWTQDVSRNVVREVHALPPDVVHIIMLKVQARCAHMLESAHAAAHLLCPSRQDLRYYEGVVSDCDARLVQEAETYILAQTWFSVASPDYEVACAQLHDIHTQRGGIAWRGRDGDREAQRCTDEVETYETGCWWWKCGQCGPQLQVIALCVMYMWTCSSPAERNRAFHEDVHTKKHNKLEFEKVVKLVEISANVRLLSHQRAGRDFALLWTVDESMLHMEGGIGTQPSWQGTDASRTQEDRERDDDSDDEDPKGEDERAGPAAHPASQEADEWSDPEDVRRRSGGGDLLGEGDGSPFERERPTSRRPHFVDTQGEPAVVEAAFAGTQGGTDAGEATSTGMQGEPQGLHETGIAALENPRLVPDQPLHDEQRTEDALPETVGMPLPTVFIEGAVGMFPGLEDIQTEFVELSFCLLRVDPNWTWEGDQRPSSETVELLVIQAWRTNVAGDLLGFVFGTVDQGYRSQIVRELTIVIARLADELPLDIVSQSDEEPVPHVLSRTLAPSLQWSACIEERWADGRFPSRSEYLDVHSLTNPCFFRQPTAFEWAALRAEEEAEEESEGELRREAGEAAARLAEDEEEEREAEEEEEEAEGETSEGEEEDEDDDEGVESGEDDREPARDDELEWVPKPDHQEENPEAAAQHKKEVVEGKRPMIDPTPNDPSKDPEPPKPEQGVLVATTSSAATTRHRPRSRSLSPSASARPPIRQRVNEGLRPSSPIHIPPSP